MSNPAPNKPVQPAAILAPAAEKVIDVVLDRDYWPKSVPSDWPEDEEYRIRAGETVALPVGEALRVVNAHIGTLADPSSVAR